MCALLGRLSLAKWAFGAIYCRVLLYELLRNASQPVSSMAECYSHVPFFVHSSSYKALFCYSMQGFFIWISGLKCSIDPAAYEVNQYKILRKNPHYFPQQNHRQSNNINYYTYWLIVLDRNYCVSGGFVILLHSIPKRNVRPTPNACWTTRDRFGGYSR